jgi:hypothetical protein
MLLIHSWEDKALGKGCLYKVTNFAVMYYSANGDNLQSAVKGNAKRISLHLSAVRFCSSLVCMYEYVLSKEVVPS